jgi:hypothetical protein
LNASRFSANFGFRISRRVEAAMFFRFLRATVWIVALALLGAVPATAQKKAFIVGIGKYQNVDPLNNTKADASAMAKLFKQFGYDVTLVDDDIGTTRLELMNAWGGFVENLKSEDEVVFYYSGHGVSLKGVNYMVPRDTPSLDAFGNETALASQLFAVPDFERQIKEAGVQITVLILDACRNDPFKPPSSQKGFGNGMGMSASIFGAKGTFIFYAADENETALEGLSSDPKNVVMLSVYTRVFVELLKKPDTYVIDVGRQLRDRVKALAYTENKHQQNPRTRDDLTDEWCFSGCTVASGGQWVKVASADGTTLDTKTILKGFADPKVDLSQSIDEVAALDDALEGNAVFMGTSDNAETCEGKNVKDSYPFGCDVLKKAAGAERASILGMPLAVKTDVNVRYRAIAKSSDERCIVRVAKTGDMLKFSRIVTDNDKRFWGVLPENKLCPGVKTADALYTVSSNSATLHDLIVEMQSENTATRRSAREKLGVFLAAPANANYIERLVEGLSATDATYRYKLGIAVALSKADAKTFSDDTVTALKDAASVTTDRTLKEAFRQAAEQY